MCDYGMAYCSVTHPDFHKGLLDRIKAIYLIGPFAFAKRKKDVTLRRVPVLYIAETNTV